MRKFLLQVLVFFVPVLLFSYVLDIIITKGVKKTTSNSTRVWGEIMSGKVNSDILIYGSSRALNHIDPFVLQDSLHLSAYNLGMAGHNFLMTKYRHDLVLKHNPAPKVIILSLDLFTLDKRKDLLGLKDFAAYLDDPIVREVSKKYEGLSFFDYNLPLVRYIGHSEIVKNSLMYAINKKGTGNVLPRGYAPYNENWNGEFDSVKLTMKKFKTNFDPQTVALFDQFLSNCASNGTKVVFVYSPEYYEGKPFLENRTEMMDTFKYYSAKYKIPFFNYFDDTLCNSKEYFYNALHLNQKGATIFSKQFAHDIKELHITDGISAR